MNTPARLAIYALTVGVGFAGAYGAGRAVGPVVADPVAANSEHGTAHSPASGGGHAAGHRAGHGAGNTPGGGAATTTPGGLRVTADGYTLQPVSGPFRAGEPDTLAFRIIGPDGEKVTSYTPTHTKRMHVIVVRRDLSGYQHLHPTLRDGTWRTPLTVPSAGSYRVFADFLPAGREEALTLGADVAVAGDFEPRPLPDPRPTTTVDGYTVSRHGQVTPGESSTLTFTVTRDGRPVTDLQPYLGAYGHLVALRDGDLAYLHVHPEGEPGDGRTEPGPDVTFYAEAPSTGSYRLFLDFRHGGEVHTAAFTVTAEGTTTGAPESGHRDGTDTGHSHGAGQHHEEG